MSKPGVGVVVGRFQVAELTAGHISLLNKANDHGKMCVVIGVTSQAVTQDDPLDYPSREQMIREIYPEAQVLPIHDQPLNALWVQNLNDAVGSIYQFSELTFYHGRDSGFAKVYKGKHKVQEVDPVEGVSGTRSREDIAGTTVGSRAWRAGAIHAAYNQYARINLCVDIGVTRSRGNPEDPNGPDILELLVGSRVNEGGAFRLPGGHVDGTDPDTSFAAQRELTEETGLEVSHLSLVGGYRVKSWRASKNVTYFTNLYHAQYGFGAAKGADDLDKVQWLPFSRIDKVAWADDHLMLATMIKEYVNGK